MGKRIQLCLARMSENGEEQKYVQEAFDTNWIAPLGPNVFAFENDLENWISDSLLSRKSVVALSSGTAAIHLALVASGVEKGDEVICQSFTFCASANPITYIGAKPVFVDSESDSWNMDPSLLEYAIKDRISKTGRKPKAIIVVHLFGMPAKMEELVSVSKRYEIPLIEDAAEALGSKYKGQQCGTFGDFGVYSFNGNKMITTSGGGALVCNDEEVKRRIVYLATQAREPRPYYHHLEIGYNYRLSNVCAGIGRGQMTVLQKHIDHHKHIADLYKKAFSQVDNVEYHDNPSGSFDSNFWLSTILVNGFDEEICVNREPSPCDFIERMRAEMDDKGVETRPLWKPMHLQPVYEEAPKYTNGVSENLFKKGLCLPSGPCVSDSDVEYVIGVIKALV